MQVCSKKMILASDSCDLSRGPVPISRQDIIVTPLKDWHNVRQSLDTDIGGSK